VIHRLDSAGANTGGDGSRSAAADCGAEHLRYLFDVWNIRSI